MFRLDTPPSQDTEVRSQIAANSVAITTGDAVYVNAAGFLDLVVDGSVKIDGVAQFTYTFTADNQTVAQKEMLYWVATPGHTRFITTGDNTLLQTDIMEAYDTNATSDGITGAGAATGQWKIITIDPLLEGNTYKCTVVLAEFQGDSYAQS